MASETRLRELREVRAGLSGGLGLSELDIRLHNLLAAPGTWRGAPYTTSLDHTVRLISMAFPRFWHLSGMSSRMGNASIGPDYLAPDSAGLLREWPETQCHKGWHAMIRPQEGAHPDMRPQMERQAQIAALLDCALQAETFREERKP